MGIFCGKTIRINIPERNKNIRVEFRFALTTDFWIERENMSKDPWEDILCGISVLIYE